MCDSVAAKLGSPEFTAGLEQLKTQFQFTRSDLVTFMCNSVAKRLLKPEFVAALGRACQHVRRVGLHTSALKAAVGNNTAMIDALPCIADHLLRCSDTESVRVFLNRFRVSYKHKTEMARALRRGGALHQN